MSVSGLYLLDKNEDYDQILKVLGIPEARAEKLLAARPHLEVDLTSDTLKVLTRSGDLTFENSVTCGKPGKINVGGIEYELNITFNGNIGTGTLGIGSKKGEVMVEVSSTGFIQTIVMEGVTAKRHYKRL